VHFFRHAGDFSAWLESYRCGFFDHPRRINAGELAEKMGMHKTTLLEHIHKAEKRLIGHILEQVA
jgi:predicted DNA binding protein